MMLEQQIALFHFLRPWWLLGLLPVLLICWLLWRQRRERRGWQDVIAPHLAKRLVLPATQQQRSQLRWTLPLALLCLVLAIAGPTWEQRPQPVYQLNAGQVIVLDLSMSMRATDLTPNRLEQMRFKAMSLANDYLDGETGLIAYAGDAFIISPLTRDAASLSNLIRALTPEIMPAQGSHPLSGLELADQLLREAGYAAGDIYWFTDGIETRDQAALTNFVRNHPHRLAIMALGTEAGAPIRLLDGNLLRDRGGDVVVPKLTPERLATLADLSKGRFTMWRQDAQDLDYLSALPPLSRDGTETDDQRGDAWYDMGPWLLLVSLLLLLPSARRGLLVVGGMTLLSGSLLTPPVWAQQTPSPTNENAGLAWHEQLWQTPYQQADQALQTEAYERAAQIATDPLQRGTAHYRQGAYEQALLDFSQVDSATGYYNQGNSLMQMGRYDEAANVYREALKREPSLQQAQQNLELAEQLAEEQQQQQQSGDGEQQEGESSSQEQQQSGEQNSDGSGEQQQDPQSSEQPQEQEQEQEQPNEQQREAEASETDATEAQDDAEGEQQQAQMTPAEQLSEEQRQQLEQWLNRIEDNPAYLLQRKMLEEAKRRDRQSPPQGVEKQW